MPAGKPLHILVGLKNNGNKEFIVQTLDASFRYPQDYNYFIQNFTAISYNSVVAPGEEGTFRYSFFPHESYGGRPFGLTVLMFFKDSVSVKHSLLYSTCTVFSSCFFLCEGFEKHFFDFFILKLLVFTHSFNFWCISL